MEVLATTLPVLSTWFLCPPTGRTHFGAALQLLRSRHSVPRSGEHQTEGCGEGEANQPDSCFGPLLLVGEISLVPASTGEDEPLLPVPPVLAIR